MHPVPKHAIRRSLLAAAIAAITSFPCAATALETVAPQPAMDSMVSTEAQAVLDRMTEFLRTQSAFTIDSVSTRDEVIAFGYKLQRQETATVTVRRPDGMRASVRGDLGERSFVYDGRQLTMYSPDDLAFARVAAPGTLAELIERLRGIGVDLPLVDVLYNATSGTLAEGARGGVLVGTSLIDGTPCDHLAFRHGQVDWQIWVQQGEIPVPRRIVITTRYEYSAPQFQATLRWNLSPRVGAKTFAFDPPKDAVEITLENAAALQGGKP